MSIESKIALAMSADGDSFERVHSNLVKIVDEFAIGFAEWLDRLRVIDNAVYSYNSYTELLEIYKKEKGL